MRQLAKIAKSRRLLRNGGNLTSITKPESTDPKRLPSWSNLQLKSRSSPEPLEMPFAQRVGRTRLSMKESQSGLGFRKLDALTGSIKPSRNIKDDLDEMNSV